MAIFESMKKKNHEKIEFFQENTTGLKLIYAVHNRGNGVTFGGLRNMKVSEHEGVTEALRMSEAMTHKLSLIKEPYGGSKGIVLTLHTENTPELLKKIAQTIENLKGELITSIDYGFDNTDAALMQKYTKYMLAMPGSRYGISGVSTAKGVLLGIRACLKERFGDNSMKNRKFAIQGLGKVGYTLAELLHKAGGRIIVSDTDRRKTKLFENRAEIVAPDRIMSVDADVLSPCGPSYIISSRIIPGLKFSIIAGGANCQLEDESVDDELLMEKGILFAPDFAINPGGVMQGICEYKGEEPETLEGKLPIIEKNLEKIFELSKTGNTGTMKAAKEIAVGRRKKLNSSA